MTDSRSKFDRHKPEDSVDLTTRIKKLSFPLENSLGELDEPTGTALLFTRDAESRKWGPRWLGQFGLQTTLSEDCANALDVVAAAAPDVVLVDASLSNGNKQPVYEQIHASASVDVPVIVLCPSKREVSAVLNTGVHDATCKPFKWQSIANRARLAWQLKEKERLLEANNVLLSEALRLAETARTDLRSQQKFEPVTGLPNKTKFMELLRRSIRAKELEQNALAVIVVGFTRFHLVVEAMGQEQADSILTEIGQILADFLRDHQARDTNINGLNTAAAANLDQHRFAMMLSCCGEKDELVSFQQSLFDSLSKPIQIEGQIVQLSACVGIAIYPDDAKGADRLLQRADNAMRNAQSRGGGYRFYCAETNEAAARKLGLEHMLHEALEQSELSLAYQPIVNTATGKMIAAEALLRWRQPDGAYISPEEFVPVAEESGLIIRAGEFVLDESCRQLAEWQSNGVALPMICVNVAKAQLISDGFVNSVHRTIERYGISPRNLELEISERGVLSRDQDILERLHELKDLGVSLAIDDFGTGDSAIGYLKDLPIDTLKIDRSYIEGLTTDQKDVAITSAIVALGQRLGLNVVAEGVETDEQLAVLRNLDCEAFQGFLESKAVTAATIAARFRK